MPTTEIVQPVELALHWQVVQTFHRYGTAYQVALVATEEMAESFASTLTATTGHRHEARPVDEFEVMADYADRLLRRPAGVTDELAERDI